MKEKRTVGTILQESFGFYRVNYLKLFVTALIVFGVSSLYEYAMHYLRVSAGLEYLIKYDSRQTPLFVIIFLQVLSSAILQFINIPSQMFSYNANDTALHFIKGGKPEVKVIAAHFGQRWLRYLGLAAWTTLWVAIWSLLFYVPAIIKGYSYRLAPYLIIQYPGMTVREALQKSKEITNGFKGRLFALDVCISGPFMALIYIILVIYRFTNPAASTYWITNGILLVSGLFYTQPLSYIAFAKIYLDIKQSAIERGILP